jgi:hypothetical protein
MATDVTVTGYPGLVTIPFTTQQLAVLAQGAANAISNLPTSDTYFAPSVPTVPTVVGVHGIVLYGTGDTAPNVIGTANYASVVGGGDHITYTAVGRNQDIFFSGDSVGGNLLRDGSWFSQTYNIDAGGSSASIGTTIDARSGSATVNAHSGYLSVAAGAYGVVLNDITGNIPATIPSHITVGGGNVTVEGSGTNASTIDLAGGNFSIGNLGSGTRITFSGADTVSFASTAVAVSALALTNVPLQTGTGVVTDITTATGGERLLITGTNNASTYFIQPSGNNVLYFGTVSQTDWNGVPVASTGFTANNVTVGSSTGSQTVFGGGSASGGTLQAEYGGTSGNNLLVGAVSIFGGGSGDTLQAGAHTTYIQAASAGNATLIGSDLTGAAAETLVGNNNGDTFVFGTGNETLTGGTSVDQFVDINLHAQNTTVTITDFVTGSDKVDLASLVNTTAISSVVSDVVYGTGSSGYTLVTLSDGVTIKFAGYGAGVATPISASDFVNKPGTIQPGTIA